MDQTDLLTIILETFRNHDLVEHSFEFSGNPFSSLETLQLTNATFSALQASLNMQDKTYKEIFNLMTLRIFAGTFHYYHQF